MKNRIAKLVEQSLRQLPDLADAVAELHVASSVERTREVKNGDFASNVAMRLARQAGKSPRDLAAAIIDALPESPLIEKVEIAGPGFINFYLGDAAFHAEVVAAIESGDAFGRQAMRETPKVLLEFVSANPTGPLHVGHGRHASFGATLGNVLEAAGYNVDREYYVNDAGRQMDILGVSVLLRGLELKGESIRVPEGGYEGEYIRDIAAQVGVPAIDSAALLAKLPPASDKDKHVDALIRNARALLGDDEFNALRKRAYDSIRDEIREDLEEFGVSFDRWYSEQSLTDNGRIDAALDVLTEREMLYEKDGATWFKAMEFGDEKDRVVVRADGNRTYFASDIAYHYDKRQRGYDHLIDVLGADHHGYVSRVRAGLEAMGYPGESLEVPFVQFVSLFEGGEKQSMGTRSGKFVTLRQLRNDVGNDAARFFYVMRSNDQHLDFDLDLARERSNENPVYYVQYAHARINQVFEQLEAKSLAYNEANGIAHISLLTETHEKSLMSSLSRYAEVIELAASNRAPQHLVHYLRDLAADFHAYYNAHIFIADDAALRDARLTLIRAARVVLANGLGIIGVSAPKSM